MKDDEMRKSYTFMNLSDGTRVIEEEGIHVHIDKYGNHNRYEDEDDPELAELLKTVVESGGVDFSIKSYEEQDE
jgi:hypothetical protein